MPERGSLDALFWKALLVAGALWLLYLCLDIVLLTLSALVLAAAILPLADSLQKRRVPRAVTVCGLYAIGLGVQTLVERSLQATRGLFTGAFAALLVLFVAGYIVVDRRRLADGLLRFVPCPSRTRTAKVATDVMRRMGGYIRGQMIVSACAAALLTIGLMIVGFEAPLLIGVLAGALNFVPYLGSTVSFILAILLALNSSVFTIVGVVAVFVIEQFLEGNFLVPYFTGRQVELHPLAVLAALIVC